MRDLPGLNKFSKVLFPIKMQLKKRALRGVWLMDFDFFKISVGRLK
jgi:hypothetical protein